jgi:hypothetical protein
MALQYNIATLINDRLNKILSDCGNSAIFQLWTGAEPAHCLTAASGTNLSSDTIPVATGAWLAAASGGSVAKTGTWTLNGLAAGVAGYFRIYDSGTATCYVQGSVTLTGSGGDMTMDNTNIASSQVITVNTFSITGANQ